MQTVLYANGNLGKSSLLSIFEIYGLFFITDALGIDPATAGLVMFISLVWDAVTDPILGFIGDKYQGTANTLVIFSVIGIPMTTGAFLLLFFSPAIGIINDWIVLLILLLFRTGYTIIDVPHNSLFVRFTNSSQDSANLAALRLFFSALGRVSVTSLATFLVVTDEPTITTSGFQTLALVVTVIFILSFGLCVASVRHVRIHEQVHKRGNQLSALARTLKAPSVSNVFLLTAINSFCLPLLMSSLVYIGTYHSERQNSGMVLVNLVAISQILSLYFWSRSYGWFKDKHRPAVIAYIVLASAILVGAFLIENIAFAYLFAITLGVAASGMSLTNWSMLPKALSTVSTDSDKNNLSVFALYTLTNKVLNGFSQGFLGLLLAMVNYDSQTADSSTMRDIYIFIFGSAFLLTALAIFVSIKLNKFFKTHSS